MCAAARQALAGVGFSEPRRRGDREAIRVLLATRAHAVIFRTRAISALHALVASAPDDLRERLRRLPLGQLVDTCAACVIRHDEAWRSPPPYLGCGPPHAGQSLVSGKPPRSRCRSTGWSAGSPPSCSGQLGIGPDVAGQVITSGRVTAASVPRLPSPSSAVARPSRRRRAHHPAPTGRSGDRQLNRALHTIVLVRMRQDSATKYYIERRLAQGKTIRDIKRCLTLYRPTTVSPA
jgi:transposase